MNEELPSAEVRIEIPFHDLDPATIVWFGNIYKYFDRARGELMSSIDYGMKEMKASGFFWPIIESKCRHIQQMELRDEITVRATIEEYQHRLKIHYLARTADGEQRVARGHTVQVAVEIESGEMYLESPDVLFHKLGVPLPDDRDES